MIELSRLRVGVIIGLCQLRAHTRSLLGDPVFQQLRTRHVLVDQAAHGHALVLALQRCSSITKQAT